MSAGAKIAMDSGTENMDWISRVLRGIIEFTQDGGEINVVVTGINVGAQPYWNAEATMLMHTKGILVMTPDSAMVLTGKQSLDYSGGVSAEDNFGIGGYDRIMGPNGQAQYWAPDLSGAVDVLLRHYAHTYRAPGEPFPRPAPTLDPDDRDISDSPHVRARAARLHAPSGRSSRRTRSARSRFDIRSVLRAVSDADHPTAGALGGHDRRRGRGRAGRAPGRAAGGADRHRVPAAAPARPGAGGRADHRSPRARCSRARRRRRPGRSTRPAATGRWSCWPTCPGFDGSPESLRGLQLEYGAEIGRAVVNFRGPIVFCVVSRYHGGAFVVFSATLNDAMEVAAVEGSYASVIGGAPAAAVVFAGEVNKRTAADPRIAELEAAIGRARAEGAESEAGAADRRTGPAAARRCVRPSSARWPTSSTPRTACSGRTGWARCTTIIPAVRLRPYLIDAVRRGMARHQTGNGNGTDGRKRQ